MAKGYGWELEAIQQCSEIELYRALHSLQKIKEQESINRLNELTISVAAGMGDKKAHQQVKNRAKQYEREEKLETTREKIRTGIPKVDVPFLDKDLLKDKISKVDFNGG